MTLIHTANKDYSIPESGISKLLNRLLEKKTITKPTKAFYHIPDPLFREYILREGV